MWTYDPDNLNTSTSAGRLSSVRLLVGDTDESDQQVQDEEINFALLQVGDSIYNAASWVCRVIASKYSRLVTTQLDGVLQAEYGKLAQQYTTLSMQMDSLDKKISGKSLGLSAGGVSVSESYAAEQDPERVQPAFRVGQFDNQQTSIGLLY